MPLANIIVNRQNVEHYPEGNLFRVSALEVNVLKVLPGEAVLKLPVAAAAVMAQSFDPASLELGKFVQNADELEGGAPPADSFELSYQCVYPTEEDETVDRFTLAYRHDRSVLAPLSGSRMVTAGLANKQIVDRLPRGAECEITEEAPTSSDPLHKWTHLGWITDRFSDGKVIEDDSPSHTVLLEPELNGDSMFVGAVNAYESALIDLNLNVATIGNGRALARDGFRYEVRCSAEGWDLNQSVAYDNSSVGDSYTFNADNPALSLENAAVPSSAIPVVPEAKCSVEATGDAVAAKAALATTGDTKARTPYTYFLDAEGTAEPYVRVSGETVAEQDTQMSSTGVSVDATSGLIEVSPPADGIGDEWKTQTLHFTVPDAEALDPSGYNVNIVHAYDIDTQDVVINKLVDGSDETNFDLEYSTDSAAWIALPITAGEEQIISVPVLNGELEGYSLKIREHLGSGENGPEVSWVLNGDPDTALSAEYAGGFSEAEIEISPVSDAATIPTPPLNVDVKNSYASIALDKTIDGLSAGDIFDTTLIPYENQTMTIRYKVTNTGPVEDFSSIRIYDASLNDSRFTLPDGMVINTETGELTGCEDVTFNEDGEAECVVTVTFEDVMAAFRYEADDAGATAIALKSINGRADMEARGSDNHGALRLPNFAGMLPATGVTTLVWTLGLGLLIAIGAVVYFIRSRRD